MLEEGKAGSIGELVTEVQRISKIFKPVFRDPEEIWFRGQSATSDSLLPNLYRPATRCFNYDEPSLMHRFQQLGTPIVDPLPLNEWDWYFLARHHGLPSRLLDWSESLLTAVFFALESHIPKDRLKFDDIVEKLPGPASYTDTSPVVWMLDAGSLNKAAAGDDSIFVPSVDEKEYPLTPAYLPSRLAKMPNNDLPIAILPARSNTRITAQQGMFTLHGRKEVSINEMATTEPLIKLAKLQLDTSRISHFWYELQLCGISRLTLFPDLDSVASQVCWTHQSAS
jgi:hypothetical protein